MKLFDLVFILRRARATHAAVRELRNALLVLEADRRLGGPTAARRNLAADYRHLRIHAQAAIHAAGLGPSAEVASWGVDFGAPTGDLQAWTVYGADGSLLGTVHLSRSMRPEDIQWFLSDVHTWPAGIKVVEGAHA